MLEYFSHPFIQRALIVGVMVTLCSALLGVSLVLNRFTMIGDGLSHVGFGTLAIAAAANVAPMAVSIPTALAAAILLLRTNKNGALKSDAAIAVLSSVSLAVGITVTSVYKVNIDINNYMFGSILAVNDSDVVLSVILSAVILVLFVIFYNNIFAITFDPQFSKATGIHVEFYNTLLSILMALTIVVGMRLMGTLLISSLIVFPSLISMSIFGVFKRVMIFSAVISVACFLLGLILSFYLSLPTGAAIVLVNFSVFALFYIAGRIIKHYFSPR